MIRLDAHLSPRLACWINDNLGYQAVALRDLGLRDADDTEIFARAKEADVTILTKDKDFADMVIRLGSPPKVVWLRCGNTSEASLKALLLPHLPNALEFLNAGENLVEIR
jgi:predicted nuclease of predicted toxin-antitoxin system